jgi:transcriptional regulator with XRE-family HTH domain
MPPAPAERLNETTLATSSALGEWLRSARLNQRISQRALADRSGVSRSYLCDIERGRGAQPSVGTLDKLAMALGASRTDLLRAAGVLEPATGVPEHAGERRLLALYRNLSRDAQSAVERFARFAHLEEQRWTQPQLPTLAEQDHDQSDGAVAVARPAQMGPTLFDAVEAASNHSGTTRTGRRAPEVIG